MAKQYMGNPSSVSFAQASSISYATIGIRVGATNQILGVLSTSSSGEQLWVVSDKIAIIRDNGRIQRTVGLPHDLSWSTMLSTSSQPNSVEAWKTPKQISWLADFRDLNLSGVAISCDQRPARIARIRILGKQIDTIRVEANCTSPRLGWTFKNVYWVSRTSGMVWRSVEYIHPDLDPIQIEVLRPPT